ncbi:DoxX family protein [Candidatus Woesearchaeota archaeon]|nr:DoxX family protein [Candidatus Woesearchaeota archaeon]
MDIMDKWATAWKNVFYLIFRVLIGVMFFAHGYGKVVPNFDPASMIGIAGIIEVVVGAMLVVGLFVRWASFFGAGQMLVAYFMVHAPQGWNPLVNKGELALLYFAAFCVAFILGNGKWNLQSMIMKK